MDLVAVSSQVLIHRIIHDLIDQMVQAFGRNTSYIHSGSFSYRFQSFQDRDTARIICILFRHSFYILSPFHPYEKC